MKSSEQEREKIMSTVVIQNPFPGKNLCPIVADVSHVDRLDEVRVTLGAHMSFDMSADEALKLAAAIVEAAGMRAVFTF
jgi:hypothetical protein